MHSGLKVESREVYTVRIRQTLQQVAGGQHRIDFLLAREVLGVLRLRSYFVDQTLLVKPEHC